MGSEESSLSEDFGEALPVSPIIQKVKNYLRLNIVNNKTFAFINQKFSSDLKKNSGLISRSLNPFCPIFIHKKQSKNNKKVQQQEPNEHWLSCCLISPVMAIASPLHLVDEHSKYCVKAYIQGIDHKNQHVEVGIQAVQTIEDQAICLLVLQKPIIELGWAGITFLKSEDQITNESYKIINHPKLEIDQKTQKQIFHQQITKGFYRLEEQFVGSFKTMPGSLIVKVIDKKPYLVGVQVNENEGHFITKEIMEMIGEVTTKLLGKGKEMEFVRMIDIQELEFMEKL